jgi:hypothetical protein
MSAQGQKWMRLVHVYISMICLLIVLFFSITGVTLNHPTWTFGAGPSRSSVSGTLPATFRNGDTIDWLQVAEYLRSKHSLRGAVTDNRADASQGSITFKSAGYLADTQFDAKTGAYTLNLEQTGFLGVMNDVHKGRDTSHSWSWVIDASGVLLAVISLTGLGLQLFLKKRRRSAVVTAVAGSLLLVVLIAIALR